MNRLMISLLLVFFAGNVMGAIQCNTLVCSGSYQEMVQFARLGNGDDITVFVTPDMRAAWENSGGVSTTCHMDGNTSYFLVKKAESDFDLIKDELTLAYVTGQRIRFRFLPDVANEGRCFVAYIDRMALP